MSADSGQKFIGRNRPPRVHITYEDPHNADQQVELPFVMGVMSDLSGNASKKEEPPMAEREFAEVSVDNFDKYMEKVEPALNMRVEDKLSGEADQKMGVNLTFKSLDDMSPGGVAKQVPALKELLDARNQLANLQRYMDGKVDAEVQIKELLENPQLMSALKEKRQQALDKKAEADKSEGEESES